MSLKMITGWLPKRRSANNASSGPGDLVLVNWHKLFIKFFFTLLNQLNICYHLISNCNQLKLSYLKCWLPSRAWEILGNTCLFIFWHLSVQAKPPLAYSYAENRPNLPTRMLYKCGQIHSYWFVTQWASEKSTIGTIGCASTKVKWLKIEVSYRAMVDLSWLSSDFQNWLTLLCRFLCGDIFLLFGRTGIQDWALGE